MNCVKFMIELEKKLKFAIKTLFLLYLNFFFTMKLIYLLYEVLNFMKSAEVGGFILMKYCKITLICFNLSILDSLCFFVRK